MAQALLKNLVEQKYSNTKPGTMVVGPTRAQANQELQRIQSQIQNQQKIQKVIYQNIKTNNPAPISQTHLQNLAAGKFTPRSTYYDSLSNYENLKNNNYNRNQPNYKLVQSNITNNLAKIVQTNVGAKR
jgi:hypothetical protein